MPRALYLQSQTRLCSCLGTAPSPAEPGELQGLVGWCWMVGPGILPGCSARSRVEPWGGFTLHSQTKNRSRKANGSSCASVSLPILINRPSRHHRLRSGARGSETPCSGLATQKGPCQPRGPWGTWGNAGFQTSSVSQQALVRFAGGAKPVSKHCFPASAWPGVFCIFLWPHSQSSQSPENKPS